MKALVTKNIVLLAVLALVPSVIPAQQHPAEPPYVLRAVAPIYPPIAGLALPQGGDVMIEVTVGQEGEVEGAKPLEGSRLLYDASLALRNIGNSKHQTLKRKSY